jgi:hypothetical protein
VPDVISIVPLTSEPRWIRIAAVTKKIDGYDRGSTL